MPHQPRSSPSVPTVEQIDDYHGTLVADPYRWLEDLDSPETSAWVRAQNEVTFDYLEQIPQRAEFRARLTELWDYERFNTPARFGARYFLMRNDGLQNQPVMLVADTLDGPWRVLADPNTWSEDGTVAIVDYQPSADGALLAYAVADAGSDWLIWRVIDVATGEVLPDEITNVKFSSVAWLPDGTGFFYARYDRRADLEDRNEFQKLWFHRMGTGQGDDLLVLERPDRAEMGFAPRVTDDGRYLVVSLWIGSDRRNGVVVRDLRDDPEGWIDLLPDFDGEYALIDNDGPVLFFRTDKDGARGRLIAIDVRAPEPERWVEIIPEGPDTLVGVSCVGDRFIAQWLRDARSAVTIHAMDGALERELTLPGIGSVAGFGGKRAHDETFYWFTGYTTPAVIYRLDIRAGTSEVFRRPALRFDADAFTTEQIFATSPDGTRIPIFVTRRKDVPLDGTAPAYLYGYGGFSIPLAPAFSVSPIAWMERGGIHAVANLRGGGEYGEEWHAAGTKERKQNVFDDFIAAAEHLVANGYTSPERLAISGGSNGGLLVGACITQRPDLFGGAIIAVGVLDMLRFHRFTIGWAWVSDYGSPDDPEMFKHLYAYSPLHSLREGTAYPATLVTTADHDDRVVPSHSFKFTSRLQAAHAGDAPVLIRVDVRAGHGMGKPTGKVIEEAADVLAFLDHVLRV